MVRIYVGRLFKQTLALVAGLLCLNVFFLKLESKHRHDRRFLDKTIGIQKGKYLTTKDTPPILSAIISLDQKDVILIHMFAKSNFNWTCCIMDTDQNIYKSPSSFLTQFLCNSFDQCTHVRAPYPARQVACAAQSKTTNSLISLTNKGCSMDVNHYHPVLQAKHNTDRLGVCAKIAYNSVHQPFRLVEWMEFQKLMGVDKVVVYTLDVLPEVMEVFNFYAQQGFLETIPYFLAGDLARSMRDGNRSFPQFHHDEQLALYDCRERLSGYSHVAGIDLDEIIIPKSSQTLKELLQETLSKQYPMAGSYYFYQQFHITDWTPSHPNNQLTTVRFLQSDVPRLECQKLVYIPARTQYAYTHSCKSKAGYDSVTIKPDIAVIHHFRRCPASWMDCHTRKRILTNDTLRYQSELYVRVNTVLKELSKNPLS